MADATLPAAPIIELTQDEKAYAGLAHALMMGTWWIGPLVIYLVKKESRFVAFHSLQALLWQVVFSAVYFAGVGVLIVIVFLTAVAQSQTSPSKQQFPVALLFAMPFFWLFAMGCLAITLTLGIVFCLKAMRGEWAGYPVIGRWARKIVFG
jgi:uncharacterized membrane protein